jgi:hypothetical protein
MANGDVGLAEMIAFAHMVGKCDCTDPNTVLADCASMRANAATIAAEANPSLGRRLLDRIRR